MPGRLQRLGAALVVATGAYLVDANVFSSAPAFAGSDAGMPPVVVELFTSQGCSSCPPAEAFLNELADEDGIIALELHVDYWDYIGWPDPFASPHITQRQRDYARELELRYVYTPQMVIDGRYQEVGSDEAAIKRIVGRLAGSDSRKLGISFVAEEGNRDTVRIPARPYSGEAAVWLIAFDDKHTTKIGRGENAGRTITYMNVVNSLNRIGSWAGSEPEEIAMPQPGPGEGVAIWIQAGEAGPILAAARIENPAAQ